MQIRSWLFFSSLLALSGCSNPVDPVTPSQASRTPLPIVSEIPVEKLPNRVKSYSDEQRDDPAFEVTAENKTAIDHLRALTMMRGIQFTESSLGYCDESLATVVFTRPEAEYFLTYREASKFRNEEVTAEISTQLDRIKPEDYPMLKQIFLNMAMIAALAADCPAISDQSESNCQQLAAVLKSAEFERLIDLAMEHTELDAAFDCGILQMRFVNPPTNQPRIEIWRK